jgi:hypothetical protein
VGFFYGPPCFYKNVVSTSNSLTYRQKQLNKALRTIRSKHQKTEDNLSTLPKRIIEAVKLQN